jgi:hypothetical protein
MADGGGGAQQKRQTEFSKVTAYVQDDQGLLPSRTAQRALHGQGSFNGVIAQCSSLTSISCCVGK